MLSGCFILSSTAVTTTTTTTIHSPRSLLPPSHSNAAAATEKADGLPLHPPQTCGHRYNFHNYHRHHNLLHQAPSTSECFRLWLPPTPPPPATRTKASKSPPPPPSRHQMLQFSLNFCPSPSSPRSILLLLISAVACRRQWRRSKLEAKLGACSARASGVECALGSKASSARAHR